MMSDLSGRRVFITGGSSGIGYATAKSLVSKGAQVFITGINLSKLNNACQELHVEGSVSDVRDFLSCEHTINKAAKLFGGIDVVINCAGICILENITNFDPNDWRKIIDTNLTGTFNTCSAAIPFLKKSKRADIINLGSRAGRYALKSGTAYCASKFAIRGFSESLFLDLSDFGIGVSLIAPGTVATGLDENVVSSQMTSEDVAETILHCLSCSPTTNLNWVEMRPSKRA